MILSVDSKTQSSEVPAVVLAAGFSSRMNALKSFYPVGEELMIEHVIRLLSEGGVKKILIVTGYKDELMSRFLLNLEPLSSGLQIINNSDYINGMYSSVHKAVSTFSDSAAGFLLIPVDCPFVQHGTIHQLLSSFVSSDADIISPVFCGRAGHPPVIRNTVFGSILNSSGEGGLRAVLARPEFKTLHIELGDEGILDDVDTDAAYIKFISKYLDVELKYPVQAEVKKLWEENDLSPELIAHMEKVCDTALGFCEQMNASGSKLNPGLLSASCRLHDLCRAEPNHAAAAGLKLTELGFPAVAAIVSQHMEIDFAADSMVDEAALLYLADKMVKGDKLINLEERMYSKLEEFRDIPAALSNIRSRFEKAFLIQRKIDSICSSC